MWIYLPDSSSLPHTPIHPHDEKINWTEVLLFLGVCGIMLAPVGIAIGLLLLVAG